MVKILDFRQSAAKFLNSHLEKGSETRWIWVPYTTKYVYKQ